MMQDEAEDKQISGLQQRVLALAETASMASDIAVLVGNEISEICGHIPPSGGTEEDAPGESVRDKLDLYNTIINTALISIREDIGRL